MIYKPAPDCAINEEQAQRYGERIAALEEEFGGVGASTIVQDAKQEDSPLHDYFEWDNEVAAQGYRIEQARYLIRHINIVVKTPNGGEEEVRAFHSVTIKESPAANQRGVSYLSLQRILSDSEQRQELIDKAFKELESWRRRYHTYKELAKVVETVDKALELKVVA